ncbi:hypothetical protein R5R35_007519 [Gryllus longicercus]|uniref:C2H2-type domain-containing protein n=1 Tax=Gryllus longicercus TaxID=2509291 RepID=A0AAN9VCU2_9ORTH
MGSLIEQLTALGQGRRHPTDPFFVAGDEVCKATERQGVYDIDEEELCHQGVPAFPCHIPGCCAVFELLMDFEMHYNSLHRYPCSVCKKQLPSAHLLDLHVAESHDSFFQVQSERMPMYQCYVEECGEKFSTPKDRRDHCISLHKFPHDFRFDSSWKQKGNVKKHKKKANVEVTDVDMQQDGHHSEAKRPAKNVFRGKGKRGGRMWHSQKQSSAPQCLDVEFEQVAQELRESLPDEVMDEVTN